MSTSTDKPLPAPAPADVATPPPVNFFTPAPSWTFAKGLGKDKIWPPGW